MKESIKNLLNENKNPLLD